jgi:hypothetical protein
LPTKLRHGYARIIRCDLPQLTAFPPANGWSSIIYKWSSTFFIATNAPSTVWKVCGAMHRCCGGNQFSRSDGFPAVTSKTDGSALLLGRRRRRRSRNLRRTLCTRRWRRFHFLQFDLKNQGRVRTDIRAHCTLAIRKARGNEQLIL